VVAVIKGGTCSLGCVDWKTGKPRKLVTHSKTGICQTCLSALSRVRVKIKVQGPAYMAMRRGQASLTLVRLEEVKEHPKGYAVLGGRKYGKRN